MDWGRWTRICEDCRCDVTVPEDFVAHVKQKHAGVIPPTCWRRNRRTCA